jgi:hypothetical protein
MIKIIVGGRELGPGRYLAHGLLREAGRALAGRLVAGNSDVLDKTVRNGQDGPPAMRLAVARGDVHSTGRLTAVPPEAVRLLVFKANGSVLVHDDAGGYNPLNCIRKEFRPAVVTSA